MTDNAFWAVLVVSLATVFCFGFWCDSKVRIAEIRKRR